MFLLAISVVALMAGILLSTIATWCVRSAARERGWAKGPDSERHVHSDPIPRVGGIALYLTFISLILGETLLVGLGLQVHRPESTQMLLRILMPATLVFAVGLVDDFWGLSAVFKLAAEIAAGYWLYVQGCRVEFSNLMVRGSDMGPILSCAATIGWVVILSNAFNLIDGLDGLAAGASIFPLLTFSAVAVFHHNGQMAVAAFILIGSLIGFLRFNFNPATIFLGDCGSLFIGFILSAMSLEATQAKASTLMSVALPVVACGLPVAETLVSIMRRFLSGRPIFSADREHFHHRLLKLGFTHRQVVVLLFGVSGACSLVSVLLLFPKADAMILAALVLVLLTFVGVSRLGYPEFEEIGRLLLRTLQQKVVIAENVKLRRIADRIARAEDWSEAAELLGTGLSESQFSGMELRVYEYRNRRAGQRVFSRKIALEEESSETKWTISLQFSGEGSVGYLDLQCPYNRQDLMIDVNVLLHVLQPAFCEACSRLARESRESFLPGTAGLLAKGAGAWD